MTFWFDIPPMYSRDRNGTFLLVSKVPDQNTHTWNMIIERNRALNVISQDMSPLKTYLFDIFIILLWQSWFGVDGVGNRMNSWALNVIPQIVFLFLYLCLIFSLFYFGKADLVLMALVIGWTAELGANCRFITDLDLPLNILSQQYNYLLNILS